MESSIGDYLRLIQQPEPKWNIAEIALQVSRLMDPACDLAVYQGRLDALARRVKSRLAADADTYTVINTLNQVLFEQEGFQGNREDYYNPGNSYLVWVLDERKGIPITLSILYREIASRIGLTLDYVGMPGHFLLKCRIPARSLFIDAFNWGEILLAEECRRRMLDVYGEGVEFQRHFLDSIGERFVVLRLLMNLKHIYRVQGNPSLHIEVIHRRIPLLEDPLPEILERGLLYVSLENYRLALTDLSYFVDHTSNAEMKQMIGSQLERIRRLAEGC